MNGTVLTKIYDEPPLCEKEILRYAGCKEADSKTEALLRSCIEEAREKLSYKVCYLECDVSICGEICDIGGIEFRSKNLAQNLKNSKKAILFAATVGVGLDRLVARYGRISPSRALMLQSIGAERIEALCDAFCDDIEKEYNTALKPRFSAGYGDLSLECQKDIFALLGCEKRIGLTLTDSLLMSPSKSVTAVIGFSEEKQQLFNKCDASDKENCAYRGAI